MKYLCLIYFDEAKLAAVPAEELAAIVDECMTYSDQLGKAGHYIASHALPACATRSPPNDANCPGSGWTRTTASRASAASVRWPSCSAAIAS